MPIDTNASVRTAAYLFVLMLLTAGLSLFFFSQQSLRLDEAQSLWQTTRTPGEILSIVARDVHVPLYHELLHFWRVVMGDSVLAARMMSLLFYLLCIPALYFLGKLAYNRSAGLFAATLLAVSPFMNWYGSEIRMYTLFTFIVILNQYFFLQILKERTEKGWIGYGLTAVLGVFTHYFFFLALTVQAVFFFIKRTSFPRAAVKRFLTSWITVAVAFIPWALYVFALGEAGNQEPVLSSPTTVNLFSTLSQFLFGFQDDHLNTFFLSLWPVSILVGFLALRKTRSMQVETEYFMYTVIISVLLAFVASIAITPVFVSRYLILAVPSLYLLLTSLLSVYPPRATFIARGAVIGLMVVTLGIEIFNPATPVKEHYRQAADYLTQNAQAQDVVLLSAPFTVYPVEYYYRGEAPLLTLPLWDRYSFGAIPSFVPEELASDVEEATRNYQYAWLLLSYDQGYKEDMHLYFDNKYERVLAKNFSPGLDLYVYKLRYDTPLAQRELFSEQ
jgi:4-amino-4-deoxy-L-arabinose transferase-like glycosyltransferase